ncbi:uncharacterized protein LOC120270649 isoform X2 [Dioscorea cayenensis subsp. rotundata]|uniref:Uncharacterized protein LOC120270649 isoform X2 n=1 Tax=Dioscorea cayennensis subsp. rotundata TaxID=55577 RepID=A0AB40C1L5_DIOCR|nr:uncharacterized protein LOC120270649 isoform X2 [Dioscorea cayenensis subsp. rotundata]
MTKKMGNILNTIHPLLTHVDLDLHLLICDILDGLVMNDPFLTFLAKLLRRLNAVSVSSIEIGEPDYDTRVEAYGSIKSELFSVLKEDHALIILSQCVYDMSSEKLVFWQNASRALLSFVQFAGPILNSEKKYCDEIISKFELQDDEVNTTQRPNETCVTWMKVSIQMIIENIFLSNMREAMKKDISVQKIHRRIKALAHFRNVINVGNISEDYE